jgi:hypothetical protein
MPQKKKKRKPRSRARGAAAPARAPEQQTEETPAQSDKRRERLDARREAKAKAAVKQHRRRQRQRLTRIVVLVGTLSLIIWFLFLRNSIPDAIAGHEIEHFDPLISESGAGTLHTDQPVTYEMDPPVSGSHHPQPANCGVYSEQLPNENLVHTLEHGAVGILYNPSEAEAAEIEQIETLVQSYDSHTFSAPYPELDQPYAVVAWAHSMKLESYDEAAVEEFIEFFRQGGDAPEEQDCPTSVNNPFGEETPTPTPTVSPAPEKTEKKKKNN